MKYFTILFLLAFTAIAQNDKESHSSDNNEVLYDFNYVTGDLRSILQALGVKGEVDIITSPKIKEKISFQAKQKTWKEALEMLCNIYELTVTVEENQKYIYVQPTDEYRKRVQDNAQKEKRYEKIAPVFRKTFYVKHADAKDLHPIVVQLLRGTEGSATVVERNNAIVVNAIQKKLLEIAKTLNELDVETKQVIISARLVVVNSTKLQELGVDWSAKSGTGFLPVGTDGQGTGGTAIPSMGSTRNQVGINNTPGGAAGLTTSPTTKITMGLIQGNMGLSINQILTISGSEILASPQVTTLDHVQAEVFMGKETFVSTRDDRGLATTQAVQAGIKLTVVPHITGDNKVLLELHPTNDDFADENGRVTIVKQEAKTNVVVKDGQTAIIAGLTSNKEIETESGVPFLKDIPLIGVLFKKTKLSIEKQDLIIFVTPHIVKNPVDEFIVKEELAEVKTVSPDRPIQEELIQ
jgi:type IV pilus assembly protein PilQ